MIKKFSSENRDNATNLRQNAASVNAERDGRDSDYEILLYSAEIVTNIIESNDASIRKGMANMIGQNRAKTLMKLKHIDGGDNLCEKDGITCFSRKFVSDNGTVELMLFNIKGSENIHAVCQGDNPYSEALFTLTREALGTWLQGEVLDWGRIA